MSRAALAVVAALSLTVTSLSAQRQAVRLPVDRRTVAALPAATTGFDTSSVVPRPILATRSGALGPTRVGARVGATAPTNAAVEPADEESLAGEPAKRRSSIIKGVVLGTVAGVTVVAMYNQAFCEHDGCRRDDYRDLLVGAAAGALLGAVLGHADSQQLFMPRRIAGRREF